MTNAESAKRWREKNPDHFKYLRSRTNARTFFRHHMTLSDVDEMKELMEKRIKFLKENQ